VKKIINLVSIIFSIFFSFILFVYLLTPKGLIFLWSINKIFPVVAKEVKETFLGAELIDTKVKAGTIELDIKRIIIKGPYLFIPCQHGFIKITYQPLKKVFFKSENFSGSCIGLSKVKKIQGTLVITYPIKIYGMLEVDGVKYMKMKISKVFLNFKGEYLIFQIPSIGIKEKISLKNAFKM